MRPIPTLTIGFFALLSIAALASPAPAFAQNDALLGKTAMSVYVSVYGDNEINPTELRLSLEQQLHEMGIIVLPHGDPPNFPVLNLTITVGAGTVRTVITRNGSTQSFDQPTSTYSSKIELRQLAPGRTAAMKPIQDVAIWTKATDEQKISSVTAWKIPGEALDLAIAFAKDWLAVNGRNHPATQDRPMPLPNPNAPSPPSSEPGQSLYAGGSCEVRAGGGCVELISRVVTDSVEGVPNSQTAMVLKQIEDLKNQGQKVITCEYGPINPQTKLGYVTFHFWYQSAPPGILKLLTSASPHPFMNLGRVAVTACPATKALASVVDAGRFN